ncbi:Uncharacterized protein OS=Acaryochloris marina (strain MBIC 11017) GN=AM1_A0039 PE=4 SV=1 [Gemmata massiliana]|uniref:ParB/Sulfiredoxin domain-containing protein n=1 Tax=Gemmata massiliana TaxID=1210884 RepID=A0A6P2DK57_9BACT|nr:hypothetical protein [Gemmata massiliana]VTS00773.1 Uncharacterized protein OS=Acaryochloris marina (strain MBIC 11017) GN=AM1_A0039 PE=4 SV=1 [Gemmata massiliana]
MNKTNPAPEVVNVPLSEVDFGPAKKGRATLNAEAVERYAESVTEWTDSKPIDLFYGHVPDGARYYFAGDGWHRGEAMLKLKRLTIKATITRCESATEAERQATLFALSGRANRVHGVPRSNEDKRAAIRYALLMREHEGHSDRKIAQLCDVSHLLVGSVRHEMTSAGELTGKASAENPDRGYRDGATIRGGCHREKNGRIVVTAAAEVLAPEQKRTDLSAGNLTSDVKPNEGTAPSTGETLAAQPVSATEELDASGRVKDRYGRIIPASLAGVARAFTATAATRRDWNREIRQLRELQKLFRGDVERKGLIQNEGTLQRIENAIESLRGLVLNSLPEAVCPSVNADGEHDADTVLSNLKRCHLCVGRMWLTSDEIERYDKVHNVKDRCSRWASESTVTEPMKPTSEVAVTECGERTLLAKPEDAEDMAAV